MAAGLQESSVAHLDDLAPDSPAHFAGQVQAGVCLIHGVTLRTGEVDEVAAVLQHLRAAGLFPGATALQRMLVSMSLMATFLVRVFSAPFVEV